MKKILKTIVFLFVSTFLFQGFQCGSKEFTSAKTSLKRGDTLAAIGYLKQELVNNPANVEAKLLLTDLTYKTAVKEGYNENRQPVQEVISITQLREAAKMSVDTYDEVKVSQDKKFLQSMQQSIWVLSFNEGLKWYNNAESGKMSPAVDSALSLWEIGMIVRPRNTAFLNLMGMAYAKAGSRDKEEEVNIKYSDLVLSNSKAILDKGIHIEYPTNKLGSLLGELNSSRIDTAKKNGNTYYKKTDIYKDSGTQTYIFSGKGADDKEYTVKGWLYDVPEVYTRNDVNWNEMNVSPITLLAENAYQAEDYDTAIGYLDKLLLFMPKDRQINQLKVQAYVNKGSGDVAVGELKSLIKKDPSRKEYQLQLGDLYSEMKDYENATIAYEAAVKLDAKYDYALRNLASVYKNRAANIQDAELDKQKADKNYKPQTDLYFPLLEKSAEYFKRSTQTEVFKSDFETYIELYNIYDVMGKSDEKKLVLKDLEKLESSIPENRKPSYYYKMLKIYSDEKMNDQVTRISNIIQQKGY